VPSGVLQQPPSAVCRNRLPAKIENREEKRHASIKGKYVAANRRTASTTLRVLNAEYKHDAHAPASQSVYAKYES